MVVASMVGTGIFTSLGFQLEALPSPYITLAIWVLGAFIAFCGASTYAELVEQYPRSGGEYHYMKHMFGDRAGFLTGFITIVAGFAAPIAASSYAFAKYSLSFLALDLSTQPQLEKGITVAMASGLLLLFYTIHCRKNSWIPFIQRTFVLFTLTLIGIFVFSLLINTPPDNAALFTYGNSPSAIFTEFNTFFSSSSGSTSANTSFVLAFLMVFYSYSGWNAPVYIADEFKGNTRQIRKGLFWGTGLVGALYLLLNFTFLYSAPLKSLLAREDVAYAAASFSLGEDAARFLSFVISACLMASTFCMMWTGSRVLKRMAEEHEFLRSFQYSNRHDQPSRALIGLITLSLIFLFSLSFNTIIMYVGYLLLLATLLCSIGLIWQNLRHKKGLRSFSPLTCLYIAVVSYVLSRSLLENPWLILICGGSLFLGFLIYEWNSPNGNWSNRMKVLFKRRRTSNAS